MMGQWKIAYNIDNQIIVLIVAPSGYFGVLGQLVVSGLGSCTGRRVSLRPIAMKRPVTMKRPASFAQAGRLHVI